MVIQQASQFAGIKNAAKVNIHSVRDVLAGRASEGPLNSTTLVSGTGGQPFHPSSNWFNFGKVESDQGTPSAGMDISHFRVYDYDLTSEDIKKDVSDGWSTTWF
jgi:hypothetical protein